MLQLAFELNVLRRSVKFWPISTFGLFGAVFCRFYSVKRGKKSNAMLWVIFEVCDPTQGVLGSQD